MRLSFTVEVEVERMTGKFASKDEVREVLEEAITEGIEGADLSSLGADSESEYEVSSVDVNEGAR